MDLLIQARKDQKIRKKVKTLDNDAGFFSGTSVSDKFRKAKLHLTTSDAMNLRGQNLTSEENARFIHGVLGPMLYKYGEGSYYSESEHCMEDGQWQARC